MKGNEIQALALRICELAELPIAEAAGAIGIPQRHALAIASGRDWPDVPSGDRRFDAVQKLLYQHNAAPATAA